MYQPVVPFTGIGGLLFVERTRDTQQTVFDQSPAIAREMEYFRDNIANALTPDDLVNDRILRKVALGAFGLDDDIDKIYFVKKILEDGTENGDALANKIVDPRYREFSSFFGYGNALGARVGLSDFANNVLDQYKTRQFEIAVGNADNSVRLAMNFKREISKFFPASAESDEAGTPWYQIMGNTPVRTIFETAFGLPSSIGVLDIDRQRTIFEERSEQFFGSSSVDVFRDEEAVDKLLRNFFAQEQLTQGPSTAVAGSAALTLLTSGGLGASASQNLLLSSIG